MTKNNRIYLIIAASIVAVGSLVLGARQLYVSEDEKTAMQEEQRIRTREQSLIAEISRLTELARTTSTTAVTGVSGQSALRISAQEEGAAIIIDSAVLEDSGFVVVYILDPKENVYTFFNTSNYLDRGAHTLLSIAAPTKLTPQNSYIATIYKDANGSKQYEEGSDTAVMTGEGTRFEVTIPIQKAQ